VSALGLDPDSIVLDLAAGTGKPHRRFMRTTLYWTRLSA